MDPELEAIAERAAGPPSGAADLEAIRAGVRRRRWRRRAAIGAVMIVAALAVAIPGIDLLTDDERLVVVGQPVSPPLVAFDPDTATGDAPELDARRRAQQPRQLPAGYRRCHGPAPAPDRSGPHVTRYCGPDGVVELGAGPHQAFEESGEPVALGTRTAWLDGAHPDVWRLTLSDRDSMQDVHWRLVAPRSWSPAALVGVLRSVPAVAEATS